MLCNCKDYDMYDNDYEYKGVQTKKKKNENIADGDGLYCVVYTA